MENFVQERRLIERLTWLIKLRWLAVAGVAVTVFFALYILKLPLPALALYSLNLILGLYNLGFLFILNLVKSKKAPSVFVNKMANTQISLDLFTLVILIHFSGGIENPFIFYFIFHMIIASILLSRRASFMQATFAVFLFSSLVILEYFGLLAHYSLEGFIPHTLHNNLVYILGVSFVFVSTMYIAVYMASSISIRLKDREINLEEANTLLKEKDRIKSEYVLRVTHDIKEHLSSIESCIEPVTAGITGGLNKKQRDLLARSESRTRKLLFFVDELLEITRLKLTKQLKMEPFSFSESIRTIASDFAAEAELRNIAFSLNIDSSIERIEGVSIYLEEAISNLLANSLKYTLPRGKISLVARDKGNILLIEIKDTGIGIPKEELGFIFDEFYRARNARGIERLGTGLGLSITKEIIEMHKGKIWVESELNTGTGFFIELPKKL